MEASNQQPAGNFSFQLLGGVCWNNHVYIKTLIKHWQWKSLRSIWTLWNRPIEMFHHPAMLETAERIILRFVRMIHSKRPGNVPCFQIPTRSLHVARWVSRGRLWSQHLPEQTSQRETGDLLAWTSHGKTPTFSAEPKQRGSSRLDLMNFCSSGTREKHTKVDWQMVGIFWVVNHTQRSFHSLQKGNICRTHRIKICNASSTYKNSWKASTSKDISGTLFHIFRPTKILVLMDIIQQAGLIFLEPRCIPNIKLKSPHSRWYVEVTMNYWVLLPEIRVE